MTEGFSNKEILQELMKETKGQSTVLTVLVTEMKAVNSHLATLNSKVAKHEKRIGEHDGFIAKATLIVSGLATAATFIINKLFS